MKRRSLYISVGIVWYIFTPAVEVPFADMV